MSATCAIVVPSLKVLRSITDCPSSTPVASTMPLTVLRTRVETSSRSEAAPRSTICRLRMAVRRSCSASEIGVRVDLHHGFAHPNPQFGRRLEDHSFHEVDPVLLCFSSQSPLPPGQRPRVHATRLGERTQRQLGLLGICDHQGPSPRRVACHDHLQKATSPANVALSEVVSDWILRD